MRTACLLRQLQYLELRAFVNRADDRERVELEELLERFVALSVRHEQCLGALARAIASDVCASGGELTRVLANDLFSSPRVREIRARRRLLRQELLHRADQIAEELDMIVDLTHLVVERAGYPDDDAGIELEVSRRLVLLDDADAALATLSPSNVRSTVDVA